MFFPDVPFPLNTFFRGLTDNQYSDIPNRDPNYYVRFSKIFPVVCMFCASTYCMQCHFWSNNYGMNVKIKLAFANWYTVNFIFQKFKFKFLVKLSFIPFLKGNTLDNIGLWYTLYT